MTAGSPWWRWRQIIQSLYTLIEEGIKGLKCSSLAISNDEETGVGCLKFLSWQVFKLRLGKSARQKVSKTPLALRFLTDQFLSDLISRAENIMIKLFGIFFSPKYLIGGEKVSYVSSSDCHWILTFGGELHWVCRVLFTPQYWDCYPSQV